MKKSAIVRTNRIVLLATLVLLLCVPCESLGQGNEEAVLKAVESMPSAPDAQRFQDVYSLIPLAATEAEGASIPIRLGRIQFDPLKGGPAQAASGGGPERLYAEGTTAYYIVQFDGPIHMSWKEALTGTGAELFDYIPDFAFIMRMNSSREGLVRGLPHIRWLGRYEPAYKLSQQAADRIYGKIPVAEARTAGAQPGKDEAAKPQSSEGLLRVTVFPGEDLARIRSEVEAAGGTVLETVSTDWKTTLKIEIPGEGIGELASISGVKWIEPWPEWRLWNNESTQIMNIDAVRKYPPAPDPTVQLYGSGQTVAVCDTGLDQGSTAPGSLLDDFENGAGASRVSNIFTWPGATANDPASGHGTHVSGSVLGNGALSGSTPTSNLFPLTSFAGSAPKATLVFQAVGNASDSLVGLPADLNTLFAQADGAGAQLQTNSWGSSQAGQYGSYSEDVDEYVWGHRDYTILFSAGNSGIDMNTDGVVDLYSVGRPGTAKNCITVGATEGNRPAMTSTWGASWPFDFPVSPIFPDLLADNTAGMAGFSSRGPCLDGRYKPDLVAPGTFIVSTRSSAASGTGWGVYNTYYMYMGGTSMSTPLAAGAATLMREYLVNNVGISNPSAAMIKASLLNSAEDISPGQYGTGATQEIPNAPVPNNVEGWGRLNLGDGVSPVAPFQIYRWDRSSSGLNTSGEHTFTVNVTNSSEPLKVNLVWSDYPGSAAAQGGLVNDLDLRVTDPSASQHYPDRALQGSSLSTLQYNTGDESLFTTSDMAIRFTPSSYPAYVDSTTIYFYNPSNSTTAVDVVVYDDNGTSGLPGTVLFTATFTHLPSWYSTIGISGVEITEGSFYIAVRNHSQAGRGIILDATNPSGRGYFYNGATWVVSSATPYIWANVRGTPYSTSYDRVNNVVGLSLTSPAAGTYTIRVMGYNVPNPVSAPDGQPYALVVSGNIDTPTVIDLASFTAKARGDRILLEWETASEIDNAGFNLLRSTGAEGEYIRINDELIPARGGPAAGAAYSYLDEDVLPGITYYYKLEDIDDRGVSNLNGPVSASLSAKWGPASLKNSTVHGPLEAGSHPVNAILLLLAPAVAVHVWKRRRKAVL